MPKIKSNIIENHIFRESESDIEFLLLKRSHDEIYPNLWQMVSGKIEPSETAVNAAIRELKEETGLCPVKMWVAPSVNSFYLSLDDSINLVPVFASKVDNNNIIILSDEHTEYRWVSKDNAKRMLAWKGQRDSVDIIYDYFQNDKSVFAFVEIELTKNI
ncbi:MAG: NUDIX pyrophosphatase [Melioribacteraceae bacterium]|nr:NUDIX pyrophosphatase [Melioribacteraceae bacterium]MCF8265461.1 NUDIX pyrophosphatase [Melioribacteraceae bacterium]MCF8413022.1 NUDIX pyrophosphatase [Melioribacteraceae bacterium]MCF8432255.1 NUDIX pyrophosphatase [Melioribacteraceae bacterium]